MLTQNDITLEYYSNKPISYLEYFFHTSNFRISNCLIFVEELIEENQMKHALLSKMILQCGKHLLVLSTDHK